MECALAQIFSYFFIISANSFIIQSIGRNFLMKNLPFYVNSGEIFFETEKFCRTTYKEGKEMANILENINVQHGKELWNEVNSCQKLADFHRQGYISKYTWNDIYDVIAYERSREMENFISAMMATNLVKGKIRRSYLTAGDVFVGSVEDRLQDVYNDLYLMFYRRIPAWDMSFGVYLDTFLSHDIDACVRNTANFSVYGTGTGTDGPGAAISLSHMMDKNHVTGGISKNNVFKETSDESLITNAVGEIFEDIEKIVDANTGAYTVARAITPGSIDPGALQAVAFAHKFKVQISPRLHQRALNAMRAFITCDMERAV